MPPVRAVVIHHDRPDAAASTAARLLAQDVPVRVTVVDSGSSPPHLRALRAGLPEEVELIEVPENVGFGPGANTGLRRWLADGRGEPYAVVAPHDADPAPDCVRRVVSSLADRRRGGLACAEYGPGEEWRPVIDKFFGGWFVPTDRREGWESVDYPHGTLLAIRREAARDVGLFDERFCAYCEEADLGLRARRAGWEVGLVWGAVVGNGRPPRADLSRYLQLRNTLLLLEKHFGYRCAVPRMAYEAAALVRRREQPSLGSGSGDQVAVRRAARLALRDYARRRFGAPPAELLAG